MKRMTIKEVATKSVEANKSELSAVAPAINSKINVPSPQSPPCPKWSVRSADEINFDFIEKTDQQLDVIILLLLVFDCTLDCKNIRRNQ